MTINFKKINYLKRGTQRQKLAFNEIKKYRVLEILKQYNPILTGTIPIGIDLPESDLDIICECKNHSEFRKHLSREFSKFEDFKVYSTKHYETESTIVEFKTEHFIFEIFGQNIPPEKQDAYRHMIIENQVLNKKGTEFRQKIIDLKRKGIKTEAAFAKLLGLAGNPYSEILKLEINTMGNKNA